MKGKLLPAVCEGTCECYFFQLYEAFGPHLIELGATESLYFQTCISISMDNVDVMETVDRIDCVKAVWGGDLFPGAKRVWSVRFHSSE